MSPITVAFALPASKEILLPVKHTLNFILTALLLAPLASVDAAEGPASLGTFDERAKATMDAATVDFGQLKGTSPMHFWIAQRLFESGKTDQALGIVSSGVKAMRAFIEKREAAKSTNIGANGFLYWASLNCYVHWHQHFDQALLDDYRYVFTHAHNYKGTTSNLGMIHTLALLLADNIWGAENLPKDGKYGPRGDKAVKWLTERVERVAKRGSGEFASRPYMIYNVGTLLTLTNEFVDESLRRKAAMAYEMSIAHAAGTWLHGHWAVPSGRSYPDQLTQQPNGSAALLWTYFGGVTPRLNAETAAIFSAAEKYRPHPIIVKAATDRSQPYVCRSRFDGDAQFQTTFMNKTYAVFSSAVLPGTGVWGQTYPYGVMWDEPDGTKGSHLWLTVPSSDGKPLAYATHGIASRYVQFAQHRGSLLMLVDRLDDPKCKYPYALGFIPGGWRAMANGSKTEGRIFLHYGSVLIALSATEKFAWNPAAGVLSGGRRVGDSEFRIKGHALALGLETALPDDFPGTTPEKQLAAFREAVLNKSKLTLAAKTKDAAVTATFTDRDGTQIQHTFDGDTRINGTREDYESWPLLENPWMRQEFGGNLTLTDGTTKRLYDVTNWTITETK
jgi:hypothetical protein